MNLLQTIEDALVARLMLDILPDEAQVSAFPEDLERHNLLHQKGAVLVSFAGSRYQAPRPVDVVVQERQVRFDVQVRHRHRRTHGGAYDLLERVRQALTGFQVEGSTGFRPVADGFLGQQSGVWDFYMQFEATVAAVQCVQDNTFEVDQVLDGDVLIKRITNLNSDYGDLEVASA